MPDTLKCHLMDRNSGKIEAEVALRRIPHQGELISVFPFDKILQKTNQHVTYLIVQVEHLTHDSGGNHQIILHVTQQSSLSQEAPRHS